MKLRIAIQGMPGSFSEAAAIAIFGDIAELSPRPTFLLALEAVTAGDADAVVLPVENSVVGPVTESLLAIHDARHAFPDLHVVGETAIPVQHQLLALPGATIDSLRRVESQPVALAQCRAWLARHPQLQIVDASDTAAAAQAVAASGDTTRAAIASAAAGVRYGLTTLAANIQDDALNQTRFRAFAMRDIVESSP